MSVELPDRPSAAYLSQSSAPASPLDSSRPASPTFAAAAPRSTHAYPQTPDLSLGESYTPTTSYPPSTAAASLKSGSATPRSGSLSKDPLLKRQQQQQRRAGSGLLTQWFNNKGIPNEDRGRRRLSSSQVEAAPSVEATSRDSVRRIAAGQEGARRPWWHISREMAQRIVGFGMIALSVSGSQLAQKSIDPGN